LRGFSLSSSPQHSLKALLAVIPLAPKPHVSFKVCAQLRRGFLIFHILTRIIRHRD
jgi:hypothetical protein